MTHASKLRQLFIQADVIKAPGIYDGLTALMAAQAGFNALFLSGACIAFARFGRPDMGLVTASEVADTIAAIRERVNTPLIADMDTGFGNALNVQRTVKQFERAGASALQMEDQVMPKRCGHMAGKSVISTTEMVGKIKAALDARENSDTVIIARTDALGVNGFDDAMERARCYVEAGADALFIEAPKTVTQMEIIGKEFGDKLPLVHNLVEGGGSPIPGSNEMTVLKYKIALYPAALLHLFIPQAQNLLKHIHDNGSTTAMADQLLNLNDINNLLGTAELLAQGKKFGSEG
jgi:2-methylisocitrate lyase-like PEP mutase family enzyme